MVFVMWFSMGVGVIVWCSDRKLMKMSMVFILKVNSIKLKLIMLRWFVGVSVS